MTLLCLPLDSIDAEALPRDRSSLDPAALAELRRSIAATGLRQPIEVFELADPAPPLRYGLISGLRRLTALRALSAADPARPATIDAFLRSPESLPQAVTRMVEENDIRAALSPWEQARIAVVTQREGLFPTLDAAVAALYPAADRNRRGRLRAVAGVVEDLDGHFTAPETLSLRQCLRLATALRADFGPLLRTALGESRATAPEAQWALIEPILREAETLPADTGTPQANPTPTRPGRPRRMIHLRHGLTIRRELTPDGWLLRFTGPLATGTLMDEMLDEIERLYAQT
jgi:ParB family chromosome partitioning protein